jgi:hypothetical protein
MGPGLRIDGLSADAPLTAYEDAIKLSIGLRVQEGLPPDVARAIAGCQSLHRDVSLSF